MNAKRKLLSMRHTDDGIRVSDDPPIGPVDPGVQIEISAQHPHVKFIAFIVSQVSAGWQIDQITTGGQQRLREPCNAANFVPAQPFSFTRQTAFTILALCAHDVTPSTIDLGDGVECALRVTNKTTMPAYFDAAFVVEEIESRMSAA